MLTNATLVIPHSNGTVHFEEAVFEGVLTGIHPPCAGDVLQQSISLQTPQKKENWILLATEVRYGTRDGRKVDE